MAPAKTKPASDLAYLCRALKAPTLARSVERLGERARADGWSHEEFLAACLEREVAARQSSVHFERCDRMLRRLRPAASTTATTPKSASCCGSTC